MERCTTPTVDHTKTVEKRVIAIPIKAQDTCCFYEVVPYALAPNRTCFFCRYGKFQKQENMANPEGFCQFKK